MGRKKLDKSDNGFFAELATETGGQVFSEAGYVKYYVDTGNLALNYICSGKFIGGGIPGGHITEVAGPEQSAKSLLGYSVLGATQRMGGIAIYLDCERSGNPKFASQCGHLIPEELVVQYKPTFSGIEKKIIALVNYIREKKGADVPITIVWDSIGVTMTDREWQELGLPENPTKEEIKKAGGHERPGERARESGNVLRKLNPFLNENDVTLYVVNQLRQKIGVIYGNPWTRAGGGKALPYYASCILMLNCFKKMKEKGKDFPIGVNLTVRNEKNRSFMPFWGTKGIQLYFPHLDRDGGVNPLGGLLSILLNSERIAQKGKGTYEVCEKWKNGVDFVFKSSKERNDVPLELLYSYPSIIDANSEEEVREYLSPYKIAIDLTNSDNVIEDDEEGDLEAAMGHSEED